MVDIFFSETGFEGWFIGKSLGKWLGQCRWFQVVSYLGLYNEVEPPFIPSLKLT